MIQFAHITINTIYVGISKDSLEKYSLWLFNIAMENGPFIDYLSTMVIFHGYVK